MGDERRARPGYGRGRQALIDAAIRVVARTGLRGLTYRAVASEAGVTQGLVAHHFGSSDELLREALRNAAEESIERLSLKPESGMLQDLARGLSKRVATDADVEAFQFEMALEARRNPAVAQHSRQIHLGYVEATRQALESVGVAADDELANVVFAALDGLALQQLLFEDPQATDRALARLIEILSQLRSAQSEQ